MTFPSTLAMGNGPQSSFLDVLENAIAIWKAAGFGVPVQVGDNYLEEYGVGTPPRVVVIYQPKGGLGALTDGPNLGNAGGEVEAIDLYTFGRENGTDTGRFREAQQLRDDFLSALRAAGGWVKPVGRVENVSPIKADGYGAGLRSQFTYLRAIRDNYKIFAVAQTLRTNVPQPANPPPGLPATTVTLDVTVTPEDPS